MPSKKEKKRQHQLRTADKRRRQQNEMLRALVDDVVGAVKELHASAGDTTVEPERFVALLEKYLRAGDRFAGLADPAVAARGLDIVDETGRRASEVAEALRRRASADVSPRDDTPSLEATLLWWAASFYRQAHKPVEADQAASQAFDLVSSDGRARQGNDSGSRRHACVALVSLRLGVGRALQAGELALELCEDDPTDSESMALLAEAAGDIAARVSGDSAGVGGQDEVCGCGSGIVWHRCCKEGERAFYGRLVDRSALQRLHARFAEWAAQDPTVTDWLAEAVSAWPELPASGADGEPEGSGRLEVRADPGVTPSAALNLRASSMATPGVPSPVASMAVETVWLRGPDLHGAALSTSERMAREAEEPNRDSLIRRFADDNTSDADLSRLAVAWSTLAETGLWQVEDTPGAPGVWLTDIVTRARRWVMLEASQRENLARWTVLAGNLAVDRGVWRSGAAMAVLHQREADRAAEMVSAATEAVARQLAVELHLRGASAGTPREANLADPPAYGILATVGEPQDPESASMHHTVTGLLMPELLSDVATQRERGANLTNSDGEPMQLIQVVAALHDAESVAEALRRRPDFDESPNDGHGTQLVWHGRELTADERDSTLAAARQSMQRQGIDHSALQSGQSARRWVRASITISEGRLTAEVNSFARLGALRRVLTRAGVDSFAVTRRFDPRLGWPYPSAAGLQRLHSPGSPETERAWAELWIDENLPELGGATPRRSVASHRGAVLVERLLRDLEHDSDEAASRGEPPTDTDFLRRSLHAADPDSPWVEAFSQATPLALQ